ALLMTATSNRLSPLKSPTANARGADA
ncbi:unnamed protein product, partial [Rotaria socialis]